MDTNKKIIWGTVGKDSFEISTDYIKYNGEIIAPKDFDKIQNETIKIIIAQTNFDLDK